MVAGKDQSPILGRYHVISENTTGAFGTVLIAWDPKLQRRVAIKRIPLITEEDLDALSSAPTSVLPPRSQNLASSITTRLASAWSSASKRRADTPDDPVCLTDCPEGLPIREACEELSESYDEAFDTEDKFEQSESTWDSVSCAPKVFAPSDKTYNVAHRTDEKLTSSDGSPGERCHEEDASRSRLFSDRDRPQNTPDHQPTSVLHNRTRTLQHDRQSLKQLKTVHTEAQRVKRAALKEARTAGMLSHPNIVLMHDFDVEDDAAYLIMEYIDGITLAELLDAAGQLNADVVAHLAQSVGNALGFAHENGVLHLDIKPENIMIDRSGTVKIADFGMANLMSASGYRNARGGTVGYMPLEQIDLEELTEASDIFSFASVIFECLTDHAPFMAPSAKESRELLVAGAPDVLQWSEEATPQTADLLEQGLSSFVAFRPVDAQAYGLALAKSLGSAKRGQTTLVQDLNLLLTEACDQELLETEISDAQEALLQARWLPGRLIYERPLVGEIILRSLRFLCVYMAAWSLMQALGLEPTATLGAYVGLVLASISVVSPTLILGLLFVCAPALLAAGGIGSFMQTGNDLALLCGLVGSVVLLLLNIGIWFCVHLVRSSIAGLICAPCLLVPGNIMLMFTTLTGSVSSITMQTTPVSFSVCVSALGALAILCGLWLPRLAAVVVAGSSVMYGQLFWTVAHVCAPSSLLAGFGGAPTNIAAVVPALIDAFSTPSLYLLIAANMLIALMVASIMPAVRRSMWGFEHAVTYAQRHQVPLAQLGILIRPTYPYDLIRQFSLDEQGNKEKRSLDEYAHDRIDAQDLSAAQAATISDLYEAESTTNKKCWAIVIGAYLLLAMVQVVHIQLIVPQNPVLSSGNTTGFAINALLSMVLCFILLILMITLCGRALPVPSRKELRIFLDDPQQQ